MEKVLDKEQMKELLEDWTLQQRSFQILAGIDVILCLGVLIGVSRVFAKKHHHA